MSARKLGGGRILGSGKNLSPAATVLPPRTTSLQSPSASSISINSSVSTSTDPQDINSRISFDQNDDSNGTSTGSAVSVLFCPICNDEMVTLLQLNRHLDDNHKNLEEVKQDEVKDWFKTQMVKAKRFQPLAVLNQKFKSLDVFESNDSPRSPHLAPSSVPQERLEPHPDEVIRRDHWQPHGPYDRCSDPACGNRLGSNNGNVNCRKCGKLFCDEHTMYQMKLSRSAQHEPARGSWCRVCETCYKSREGYNDRNGLEHDRTADFINLRRKTVDATLLEVSRLEKRLTKLTQLLTNAMPAQAVTPGDQTTEKSNGEVGVDVRMCKECRKTVFSKQDFAASLAHKPPDVKAYENLVQFERGIRLVLPKFQRLLQALQDPDKPPTPDTLAEAAKIRKRLTDSFGQYNIAARRIRDLPTESVTQQRLQKAIFQQASSFLHVHMLPLKALPKIMKHATPSDRLMPNGKSHGALATIKLNDVDAASQASSSSAISVLEGEEKALREQLIVLEEQSFMVREQISDASRRRKFDEVSSLSRNVEDLGREIDHVQGQLDQLDFAGAYGGSGMQSPAAR
ncbi:MAG: hypothetical protein Q9218_002740 [Villophora microphyllina]